jgi:SAM-dependent methyltransferase
MAEIDMMRSYPVTDRSNLLNVREEVTREDRIIAKKFGKDYFDGPRRLGLGGYYYNPKYFTNVVSDFINQYKLKPNAKILDVGCGKGFMMKDFKDALPGAEIHGLDISEKEGFGIRQKTFLMRNSLSTATSLGNKEA